MPASPHASLTPLLRDPSHDAQPDPDFTASPQDSLQRKSRRRSVFAIPHTHTPPDEDEQQSAPPGEPVRQAWTRDRAPRPFSRPVKVLVTATLDRRAAPTLNADHTSTAENTEPYHTSQPTPDAPSSPSTVAVDVLAQDATEREQANAALALLVKEDVGQAYDVLYENQRGILFRGVPYFSAMSLFPFDPDPWTLVNPVSSATLTRPTTKQAAAHNPPLHVSSTIQHWKTAQRRNQDSARAPWRIPTFQNTPFTPVSFQLPSPAWQWSSPWSVVMQTDGRTDEHGWEYNWIFKSDGWHSHLNRLGWAGWVRRRKWTRTRELRDSKVLKVV